MINKRDLCIRDPYILPYNNGYILTGTIMNNGFCAYYSKDLENFEAPCILYAGDDKELMSCNYWAPEIHFYKGKYYMFATVRPHVGQRYSLIYVCDSPLGKYEPLTRITPLEWGCLDATLYIEDGIPYAVYCHEWTQVVDGEICAVRLSDDLTKTEGEHFLLFKASQAPWVNPISYSEFGRTFKGFVTDGPFLFKDNGKLNMMWSSFG